MTHLIDGLRSSNMYFTSISILFVKGEAQLQFPPVFKREPLQANIQCKSLWFGDNKEAGNEPLFVVCSGSSYYNQDFHLKRNIFA